ncbi:MAG: efflux RND transporter permease subunit [Planctomycetes bacterium]|nr:efflux RND transporter permease subunit [Planctomycetota bacterium]
MTDATSQGLLSKWIRFCLEQKLVVAIFTVAAIAFGLVVAPFDWDIDALPRSPVMVDAIPDIGENQQIVFTEWPGRSPQDVDDQVTYPLTVSLLGLPGVHDVRAYSAFGFSTVYVIFDEDIEFYWSRSRILEKLASLPAGTLPEGVSPALGPDATGLGQIFQYTLEGRDEEGRPTGGWDLAELRTIQDWTVRYGLLRASGVAEVSSIGGYVQEYQVDIDPDAMRAYGVNLHQVSSALKSSNIDVGARTIEVNEVEYVVRGLGFLRSIEDIESVAVATRDDLPVRVGDIASVGLGPALRRGVLDKGGTEAVGGIVVARHGANPMAVIESVKAEIERLAPGLPSKILADGTVSKVTIVPFYDRAGLIAETLGTLESAIGQQILVTIVVVVLLILNLRTSLLISSMLPLAVLLCFLAMRAFRIDANIVALSGIAIAVGTIVDMGIVLCENVVRRLEEAPPDEPRIDVVHRACVEVGSAVMTAVLTTVVSFLPVFTMTSAEGKLFKPLAFTKTFALLGSIVIALSVLPPLAHALYTWRIEARRPRRALLIAGAAFGVFLLAQSRPVLGGLVLALALVPLLREFLPERAGKRLMLGAQLAVVIAGFVLLTSAWEPLGAGAGEVRNLVLVVVAIGGLLLLFALFQRSYPRILAWCLDHKLAALTPPIAVLIVGTTVWLGFPRVFGWLPARVAEQPAAVELRHAFPGLGQEFMPALDEGSFLYMPTTMPHASLSKATEVLQAIDAAIASIPEVESAVGKIGRADSALDPAPVSMVETIITYAPEYVVDADGRRSSFAYDRELHEFQRDEHGALIPDPDGRPFRNWRDEIRSPEDIWDEILVVAQLPGVTSAPKLQPIETRVLMLQSGFRAPMGIKVSGPDLETIEAFGLELERLLADVPSIEPATVFADRVIGKPYYEIDVDRERIARHGIPLGDVQRVIEVAIGGMRSTSTVEGRERYPLRVRYPRELRDRPDELAQILVPAPGGRQIPLGELADIRYTRGPQVIKSEKTFLTSYVLFDKRPGRAEVDVVDDARRAIAAAVEQGKLEIPAGVSYRFAGSYENQVRATARLRLILPLALLVIFLILYLQFRSTLVTMMVFSGVFVAWSGGFLMLWLYDQPWFLDAEVFGTNLRQLFGVHPVNLSVAVWVGFLALFGIATDDGVVMATRLKQEFDEHTPNSVEGVRAASIAAGSRRIRACLMTTATTTLALLPVLSSTGRGSDIMIPMAIPTFGGMTVALITLFVVPVLYCWVEELKLRVR